MQSLKELYKIGHGPSSSHTIGAERACLYIKNNYKNINKINIILYGSLALTGKGHLTDIIINKNRIKTTYINMQYTCVLGKLQR